MRIELLGNLRITAGQQPLTSISTNRLQSLLAMLVLHGDVPQSREHLAFLLWPESSQAQARTNLRQLLHHLRRALPVDCSLLETDNQTVLWRRDESCSIDVVEFETAVIQAEDAEKKADFAAACKSLEEAARLYQDDLLPDLYDDWLEPKREQLRQQLAEVLSRLAALLEAAGDYPAAIRHATRLIAVDPLRERSYQTLIRLHNRNGDRSSALRVYHECMRVLRRELGISPSSVTQELFTQALKSEQPGAAPVGPPPNAAAARLPIVGRSAEWAGLVDCWRAVTHGDTHFALILGEPGIGKTRLAEELFEYCVRHPESGAARARCFFAQGRLAYGPVAEWLRAEPMRAARAQMPKAQLAEIARVLPEILVENPEIAPPAPLTESWQRRHLYEAMNAVIGKASKPLLLLIDDLQWCDRDTFEWLHSFFHSEACVRTLVLATVRPGEIQRDHPLAGLINELQQAGNVTQFPLAPLTVAEAAALAVQIAGRDCDPAFLSRLHQAARGNPLFVVESVRASLENPEAKGSAPPRVQAVIAARIAQLSPQAYELAGLAATIGRPFSYDLLAKATDWDEDSLSRALEELWHRRIVEGQGAGAYDFSHDLLREVAYSELSPVRRRSLHRRVARAVEELHAADLDAVSGWLAAHYEAAGAAEQAVRWYHAAALVARQRFAYTEAAELIRRALRICGELPESAKRDRQELELLVTLGASLVATHGYGTPEAGEAYERGLLLSKRSGDGSHLFSVLSGSWIFNIVRGQLEASRRLGQDCIESGRKSGATGIEMAGHFLLGTTLFHLGQLEECRRHIEHAASAPGRFSHPALALFAGPDIGMFCRAYLAHVSWQLGDDGSAEESAEEAIALARDLSHPFCLAIALDYAAMLDVFRRDAKRALVRAAEACSLSKQHRFAYYLAWAEILMGWATAVERGTDEGLTLLRRGLDALRLTGAELRLPFYFGLLAEVCALSGRMEEALANVASGFAFQTKNGERWSEPELHRIHGEVLLRTGNNSGARLSYGRAIEAARSLGARMLEIRAEASLRELPGADKTRRNAAEQ